MDIVALLLTALDCRSDLHSSKLSRNYFLGISIFHFSPNVLCWQEICKCHSFLLIFSLNIYYTACSNPPELLFTGLYTVLS